MYNNYYNNNNNNFNNISHNIKNLYIPLFFAVQGRLIEEKKENKNGLQKVLGYLQTKKKLHTCHQSLRRASSG